MDATRADFLDDLMSYVKDGGIAVLSIDQLRDTKGKLDSQKLNNFLGAKIEEPLPGFPPKGKIKDYIEVIEEGPFKFEKKRYLIPPGKARIHKVIPEKATVVAKDGEGKPVLLLNKYGKGYVLLLRYHFKTFL